MKLTRDRSRSLTVSWEEEKYSHEDKKTLHLQRRYESDVCNLTREDSAKEWMLKPFNKHKVKWSNRMSRNKCPSNCPFVKEEEALGRAVEHIKALLQGLNSLLN